MLAQNVNVAFRPDDERYLLKSRDRMIETENSNLKIKIIKLLEIFKKSSRVLVMVNFFFFWGQGDGNGYL